MKDHFSKPNRQDRGSPKIGKTSCPPIPWQPSRSSIVDRIRQVRMTNLYSMNEKKELPPGAVGYRHGFRGGHLCFNEKGKREKTMKISKENDKQWSLQYLSNKVAVSIFSIQRLHYNFCKKQKKDKTGFIHLVVNYFSLISSLRQVDVGNHMWDRCVVGLWRVLPLSDCSFFGCGILV